MTSAHRADAQRAAWYHRLRGSHADRLALVLAVVAPPAAAAVLVPLRSHVTNTALALVMVGVVVAVVIPGRRWAALVAGVSAGLWFDFFLTRPYESFAITRSADIQTTVLLIAVAVGVGEVAARERFHRTEVVVSTESFAAVQDVTELVADDNVAEAVVSAVADALVPLLHLESCRFEATRVGVSVPFIDRPGYVSYSAYTWDATSHGLPVGRVALPVRFDDNLLGQFVLEVPFPAPRPSPQVLSAAIVLADLAGVALARLDRQAPGARAGSRNGHGSPPGRT
jgi:Domain of unknown function (DUF4118)